MKFIDVEQGSPEWHELRRTKIGASNSPALLGLSPYRTTANVYREMVYGEKPFINKAMQHGTDTEKEALRSFNMQKFNCSPKVVISEEYDFMMASLDGLSEDEKTIVEIKCPTPNVYHQCYNGKIPTHWEYQIQHQLCVTGLDRAFLFIYQDEMNNFSIEYSRDEKKIAKIVEACEDFEKNHFLAFVCPDDKNPEYAEREDIEWSRVADAYLEIKRRIASLEAIEEDLRNQIVSLCADKPSRGGGIRVEKSERKGLVDYSLVEELQGVNLDQYRKPSTIQWRICEIKS